MCCYKLIVVLKYYVADKMDTLGFFGGMNGMLTHLQSQKILEYSETWDAIKHSILGRKYNININVSTFQYKD